MNTIADQYYIKALDQYPFNLEESLENINYALSYDGNHCGANHLMAKLCKEYLYDTSSSERHFQMALANEPDNQKVCLDYAYLLVCNKEYAKANKLINYVRKLKGCDLGDIIGLKGLICEHKHHFDKAVSLYKKALLQAFDQDLIDQLNKDLKRVKEKRRIKKKSEKSNKRTQKTQ